MEKQFKNIGNYLIQIGLYLCTVSLKDFEENVKIKENAINYLMQSYLYLKTYDINEIENNDVNKNENNEEYLSRKEVLKLYYPLFTEYGLNQSIHTKGLPHIRRGSKYFFRKSEIDKWLDENGKNDGKNRFRYV